MRKTFSFFTLFLFYNCLILETLPGQLNQTDSLSKLLITATGIKKAETELQLARLIRRTRTAEAIKLAEDALTISRAENNKPIEFRSLVILGLFNFSISPSEETYINYIKPAKNLVSYITDDLDKSDFFQALAIYKAITGSVDSSEYFYKLALEYALNTDNKTVLSSIERNLAGIYEQKGLFREAIEYGLGSLKEAEAVSDSGSMAASMIRISYSYLQYGNYTLSLEYLQKALNITEKAHLNILQREILNCFGEVYKKLEQFDRALDYYQKALDADESLGATSNIAVFLINMGECYNKSGRPEKAIPNVEKALKLFKVANYAEGIARCNAELGVAYRDLKTYSKSEQYFNESQKLARKIELVDLIISNNKDISKLYSLQGNISKAFEYYKLYSELKDTVFSKEKAKQINEIQTRLETENKEQQIKLQEIEIEKNKAVIGRKNLQQLAMLGVIAFTLLIILLIIVGYRKIIKQRDEIKLTNTILEKQKEDIKDSINYASLIQKAILPPPEILSTNFPSHFIFIKPRDIVSGDFYWCTKIENQNIIAAVDCTGHGVPGAFMSMLGAAFLNEIINKEYITHPGVILRRLRKEIIKTLHQHGESGGLKDGMDIALCTIDLKNMKLQFAGANNPMYIIRKSDSKSIDCKNPIISENFTLFEIKGDRMPISIHESMENFTLHEIDILKGDLLYIFSDGYADQFGGPNGKKLQYRNFKKLLLDHCPESMEEQKIYLEKSLRDWQGDHNQVDDILVIGIRIA